MVIELCFFQITTLKCETRIHIEFEGALSHIAPSKKNHLKATVKESAAIHIRIIESHRVKEDIVKIYPGEMDF